MQWQNYTLVEQRREFLILLSNFDKNIKMAITIIWSKCQFVLSKMSISKLIRLSIFKFLKIQHEKFDQNIKKLFDEIIKNNVIKISTFYKTPSTSPTSTLFRYLSYHFWCTKMKFYHALKKYHIDKNIKLIKISKN